MLEASKNTVVDISLELGHNLNVLIHLIKKTRKTPKVQELLIKLMGITITMDDSLNEMLDTETATSLESGSDYDPNTNLPRGFQEKAKFHYIISIFSKEHVGSDLLKISLDYPVSTSESLEKYLQAYHNFNPHRGHFEVMLLSDIQDVSPEVTVAKSGWFK